MNNTYRLIWSSVKETWVVVAEIVRNKGSLPSFVVGSAMLLAAVLCGSLPASALDPSALPTGGHITAGSGSISQSGSAMTVNQTSDRIVANWNTFNIGQNASVAFQQPNAASVALNRIADQNPSQILGSLSANGQIFLLNPSGIIFGQTAQVNVGALVASSLNISNDNFMNGAYRFENGGAAGSILNQGSIRTADGGYVAFLAPRVKNEGSITAPNGSNVLAAADKLSLDFTGDGLLSYSVEQGAVDALAENKGLIKADNGMVVLTARAADSLTRAVVNNEGAVEAASITSKGGRIILEGDEITLAGGSRLDATGATGGGEVLVGGGWQGEGAMHQATRVTMEAGATVDVSATHNGDGGTAVLWSDITKADSLTTVRGTLLGRGGEEEGDGGRIETSGHQLSIAEEIQIDTRAPQGKAGQWLLDPVDITIAASGGNVTGADIANALKTTSVTLDTAGAGSCTGVVCGSLTAGVGNITVNDNIAVVDGDADTTLTLKANGSITVTTGKNITRTGSYKLNTVFWADSDGASGGYISLPGVLANPVSITTNGGHVAMSGGSTTETWNGLATGGGYAQGIGELWDQRGGMILQYTSVVTSGGSVKMFGQANPTSTNTSNVSGVYLTNSTVNAGNGDITLNGLADGLITRNFQGITIGASTIRNNASISLTGAGERIGTNIYSGSTILTTSTNPAHQLRVQGTATAGNITDAQTIVNLSASNLLSAGAPIEIKGSGISTNGIYLYQSAIGYKSGTSVTASNSDISFITDKITLSGGATLFQSSGQLTIRPDTATHSIGIAGGAGDLQLVADLFSNYFTNGFSGITIGSTTAGDITIGSNALTYKDPLTLKSAGNIVSNANASLTGTAGQTAHLTLWSDADGNSAGRIHLNTGSAINSNGGNITMRGGNAVLGIVPDPTLDAAGFLTAMSSTAARGEGSGHSGVTLDGATLNAGTGNIDIRGIGADEQAGVLLHNTSQLLTTGSGSISVFGVGGVNGASQSDGINHTRNAVVQTTDGAIRMDGLGRGQDSGQGVVLEFGAKVESGKGNVLVRGISQGTGDFNQGIYFDGATVKTTDTGHIDLVGRASGTGGDGHGIFSKGTLSSGGGHIAMTGTRGNASSVGIKTDAANTITAGESGGQKGNITLTANTLTLAGSLSGKGELIVQPEAANTTIGITGGTGDLQLPASNFSTNFTDGFSGITIGSATAGDITIGSNALSYGDPLTLKSARHIISVSDASLTGTAGQNAHLRLWSDADGNNAGSIYLSNRTQVTSNDGNITLGGGADGNGYAIGSGTALRTAGDAWFMEMINKNSYGIALVEASLKSGNGNITLKGKGSPNTTTLATGVVIGRGSLIESTGGNIQLTGYSGGTDGHASNGIQLGTDPEDVSGKTATVKSASGAITIDGIGGISGVADRPFNSVISGGLVESTSGNITINGNVRDGGMVGLGIYLSGGTVRSLGTAPITLNGSGKDKPENDGWLHGIELVNNPQIIGGSGTVTLIAEASGTSQAIKYTSGSISGTGNLVVKPASAASPIGIGDGATTGTGNFLLSTAFMNALVNGFSSVTLGSATAGPIVVGDATTLRDNTTLWNNGAIALNGAVTANENLSFVSNGATSQTAAITVTGTTTLTAGAANNITLDNAANNFTGAVSIISGNNVSITDSNAMTLGAVSSTGTVDIATLTGDLTLTGVVSTSDTTSTAVKLNAGKNAAAGTTAGGNIIVSGGSTSTGAGGFATLYSGSVAGSTGLTDLIVSGSGRFRYNSDETTTNYTTALTAGINAIFRDQPTVTTTANNDSKTYNGLAYSGGNGVTYAGFVNGDTSASMGGALTYGGTGQGAVNAGSYTIVPSGYTNGLGYALAYSNGTLTINPASLSVSAEAKSKTYGAVDPDLTYTYSGLVGGDNASVFSGSLTRTAGETVAGGPYAINQGTVSAGSNYTISYTGANFTINPASLSVTANNDSKVYSGTAYSGGNGVTYAGFVNGETTVVLGGVLAYGGSSQGAVNVGNYSIIPGGLTSGNYAISFNNGTLTISPAPLTVISGSLTGSVSKVYDGTTSATLNPANYSLAGWVGGDGATVTKTTGSYDNPNAGSSKTVTVNLAASDYSATGSTNLNNYSLPTIVSGPVGSISPAPLSVTANNDSKVYSGTAYSGGNGVSYAGFVNGETAAVLGGTLSYGGSSQGAVNVGNYSIIPGGLTSGNYSISFNNGAFTFNPAALTVTANNDSKLYNGVPYSGGNGVVYTGFVGGETSAVLGGTLAYGGTSQGALNPGNYTIIPGGLTSSNYAISYIDGSLTIQAVTPVAVLASITSPQLHQNGTQDKQVGDAFGGQGGLTYMGPGAGSSLFDGSGGGAAAQGGGGEQGSTGAAPSGDGGAGDSGSGETAQSGGIGLGLGGSIPFTGSDMGGLLIDRTGYRTTEEMRLL